MLKRLRNKWKVSGGRLVLIITTFAIGGSLCGYAGRKILGLTAIDKGFLWVSLYIISITLLWPISVIIVSIFTGQFSFFKRYISRVFTRMAGTKKTDRHVRIAVFGGGAGTNAQKIIETLPGYFTGDPSLRASVVLVISNNPEAGVLSVAAKYNVPSEVIQLKDKTTGEITEAYLTILKKYHIDFIVLAGYLKKIPVGVIKAYSQHILNIHPALLPKFGGAGMYGMRVHEAVIAAGEIQSGISIHRVDEVYDNGKVIFRAACEIDKTETPESLAQKIHVLEHQHYAEIIAKVIHSQNPR